MPDLVRRLRGFAIAVVVLAMTAGVASAASPGVGPHWNLAALDGLFAGQQAGDQGDEQGADQGDESEAPESEAPDASEADQSEAPESEAPESESPDTNTGTGTHGTLVSTAANMTTPDGFANHGEFVRCVAHLKDVDPTTFDWTTVTPAFCADAWGHAPKSRGHHGHHNDQ